MPTHLVTSWHLNKTLKFDYFMNDKMFEVKEQFSLFNKRSYLHLKTTSIETHLAVVRGLPTNKKSSTERQREELNWASPLKSSDQQIFSRVSGTDSPFD